jgi:hypothetical protein
MYSLALFLALNQIPSGVNGVRFVELFDDFYTFGILKDINSKIQLAKDRAHGFQNIDNDVYHSGCLVPGKGRDTHTQYL